jgi:geranylgeranyl pyrophosphate synthase
MKLQEQVQVKEFNPAEKIKTVMDIFNQLNIRSITENLANDYITKSLKLLEKVNADKDRKNELFQMAASLIDRKK